MAADAPTARRLPSALVAVCTALLPVVAQPAPNAAGATEFPWLATELGSSGEVPPPWTPLRVDQDSVEVWGRRMVFGGALLPAEISSQGVPLLAAPARLEISSGGRAVRFPQHLVSWPVLREDRAVRQIEAHAESITCRTATTIEFDGMVRISVTIAPVAAPQLDSLRLVVPLRRGVAQVCGRYLSYDFERLCADKMSLRTCVQRIGGPVHMDFNPEVWLGNRQVGLTWAAETNRQYDLDKPEQTISVVPHGDVVDLVVRVVDHAITLDRPKTFEFALFPTPLKPPDPRMRQIRIAAFGRFLSAFRAGVSRTTHDYYAVAAQSEFQALFDALPMARHNDRYRQFRERLRSEGVRYMPYGALWYTNAVLRDPRRFYPDWHVEPASQSTLKRWAEYDAGETRDLNKLEGRHWDGYRVCAASDSYADFLVWTFVNAITKEQLDGIYFDHGELSRSCRNPNHDHFRGASGDQPKAFFGVFGARELLKRLWTAGKRVKPDLLIMQHQSRALKSLNSFVDVALTGEALNVLFANSPSSRAVRENPTLYKPDYDALPDLLLSHEYLDTFGFEARILPQVKYAIQPYWKEHPGEYDFYSRKMFRHTLLNGTRQWAGNMSQVAIDEAWLALDRLGRIDDSVVFHPYWEEGGDATTAHPGILISCYQKPDCVLVIVGNTRPEDAEPELEVRSSRGFTKARYAVTGESLPLEGNRCRVAVPGGLYRALLLTR